MAGKELSSVQSGASERLMTQLLTRWFENSSIGDIGRWVSDPTMQELCAAVDVASWTEGSSLLVSLCPRITDAYVRYFRIYIYIYVYLLLALLS